MSKEIDVVSGFKTVEGAARAVDRLEADGFARERISLILNSTRHGEFVTVKDKTKAADGAAAGGIAGGAIGAILAGLAGMATIAIPGVGLFVAGPIVAALVGGGAGAAAGGVLGGLIGLGLTEHEAKLYEDLTKDGGVVVAVRVVTREDASRAKKILEEAGALQIEAERGHAIAR
jgi:hypothetical protein